MPQPLHRIALLLSQPVDRQLLADFLPELGYGALTELPPKGHLAALKDVSLIIADPHAARRYGQELLDVKWRHGGALLPLLIALPRQADGAPWLEAGFDDVLRLPLSKAELQARLAVFVRLREGSERRYEAFFRNALAGIYRATPDGRPLMANPALLRLFGYGGLEAFQADEAVAAHFRALFERCMAKAGEVAGLEARWSRPDGAAVDVLESAKVVCDGAGEVAYVEGTIEDITRLKRAESALRRSEARFRAVTEHALDVIAVLDEEARLTYLSPSVEAALGYAPEELLGERLLGHLSPEEAHYLRNELTRVLLQNGSVQTLAFAIRHKDGSVRHLSAKAKNLLGTPGIDGVLLNIRDATERERFERELVQARETAEEMTRLKSSLLANMSHEIRTPLTGIVGFASLLAEELEAGPHREFAQLISGSARRLTDMLGAVLTLAKLEADRVEVQLDPLNLYDEAESIVQLFKPMAAQKGIALGFDATEAGRAAFALLDRGAFSSILHNLLSNALKFTDQGAIAVSIDADAGGVDPASSAGQAVLAGDGEAGGRVRLRVRDTGAGIDPVFLPHLFDEFRQESTGIGRSHEGSGLGLSITKRLAALMHGEVEVESEKGVGSAFTVSFPAVAALAEPDPAPEPAPGHAAEEVAARLLVVEDNEDTAFLMQEVLESVGEVTLASNAEEALEAARRASYHAVLLDINLGRGRNGTDVLRELRTMPAYRDAPIAALTAYALPGDRERFLELGFSRYLSKPFSMEELLKLASELLRR